MKAKEIDKLIRTYVPAKILIGSNRAKFIAELQELHQQGIEKVKEKAIGAVPTNWLDPLLTGKDVPKLPWNCPEIEQLLNGVKEKIKAIIQ